MRKNTHDYSYINLDKENNNYIDEYSSPELFQRQPIIIQTIDFWALGVLIYKMLTSEFPFDIRIIENIGEKFDDNLGAKLQEAKLQIIEIPVKDEIDNQTKLLLSDLSIVSKYERLGSRENVKRIQGYSFFDEIDWFKLENGEIIPPYDPNLNVNIKKFSKSNFFIIYFYI